MLIPFLSIAQGLDQVEKVRLNELNGYWAEVERTVNEGDYEGYVATCHPSGTLVSGTGKRTYPLATALAGWKSDFVDTHSGKRNSKVEFRFSQRIGDGTTAHETGIFHYTFEQDDKAGDDYINFEALLVKDGTWKIMMEYQKSKATKSDWDSLKK